MNDFLGFNIERFEPEEGLMSYADRVTSSPESEDIEVTAFMVYWLSEDQRRGLVTEMVFVKGGSDIVLPKSVDGHKSKVCYAGPDPKFETLNKNNNLVAYVPNGSVVRVEFKGEMKNKYRHVKYFKTV